MFIVVDVRCRFEFNAHDLTRSLLFFEGTEGVHAGAVQEIFSLSFLMHESRTKKIIK